MIPKGQMARRPMATIADVVIICAQCGLPDRPAIQLGDRVPQTCIRCINEQVARITAAVRLLDDYGPNYGSDP